MWFVGFIAGLVLSSVFDSLAVSLVLSIGGAIVAQSIWNKRKAATAPVPRPRASAAPLQESEWDAGGWEAGSASAAPAGPAQGDALQALRAQVQVLERRVQVLEQRLALSASAAVEAPAAGAPVVAGVSAPVMTGAPGLPTPAPSLAQQGGFEAVPAAARPAEMARPSPSALVTRAASAAAAVAADTPAAPVRASAPAPISASASASTAATPPAKAPTPAPAVARPPPPPPPAVPLRERLPAPIAQLIFGGNLLVKAGVLILFLGLAFLLRYTAERVTVPVELRYAGVALAGAALLGLGWFLRGRRRDYALVLQGAGVAVFYLTTLAAMKLHPLLPASAGFAFLCGVALLSAALAGLQNAPVLAVVGALGGFAAPVLASTGSNNPLGLFSYLLILDLGIALIAWFKAWRLLNLIGFVGTFALASAWAQRHYTHEQYGVAQSFLLIFFVLFTGIGLLFARRTLLDAPAEADATPLATRAARALRHVGRVDSALVFGVPVTAFGLQYLLMQPGPHGAAFAALGYGFFYLLLGRGVFATQPRGLALLAEAYAIVGVIFGTLAIPLGLEGQWTGAAWAVEAAGMYWLGVRQSRPYARAFALLVLGGAVFKLMQATNIVALPGGPLLHGSVIGPLLVALGSAVIAGLQRRAGLDRPVAGARLPWESLAGQALPWLVMGALTLLPWQWLTPPWAAAATALLGLAAWGAAQRWQLGRSASATGYGLQALAVASFISTLHRGGSGAGQVLANGWAGTGPALLIAGCLLAIAAVGMRQVLRAAAEREAPPDWRWPQALAALVGVGLLHLALLFQISLAQAALIWPLTATVLLWLALRLQHGPLALQAAALHVLAAGIHLFQELLRGFGAVRPDAFAHLGFWVPVVLGGTALLAGDWLRREAARPRTQRFGRLGLDACGHPALQWAAVLWGLGWWLTGWLGESARVLDLHGLGTYRVAAWVAVLLLSSVAASGLAARRDWRVLGRATLGTLPAWLLVAAGGLVLPLLAGPLLSGPLRPGDAVPSAALGWLAWPLAALWHVYLLRAQERWASRRTLAPLHVLGFWFFVLLAAREGQWQFERLGDPGSSWRWLGWVLVPALALWALRLPALRRRWPLAAFAHSYLWVAAAPVAVYLMGWLWLGNAMSPGRAAPLPYVPLLNPLELAQWLVLAALLLWWRGLPRGGVGVGVGAGAERAVLALAGATALALLTGGVLRACHHYAGVAWEVEALYASRLAQAALSITWALCGVLAMVLGHRRALRPLWLAGAALLGVVVLKLFFVELADRGGLFRIISFIGVGALLLLVGYFAPVPPARRPAQDGTEPAAPPAPAPASAPSPSTEAGP